MEFELRELRKKSNIEWVPGFKGTKLWHLKQEGELRGKKIARQYFLKKGRTHEREREKEVEKIVGTFQGEKKRKSPDDREESAAVTQAVKEALKKSKE